MTEDRNQTLADALEELGFRGHVPNQWVPMVAEVRRARLLSILRPGGVAVFRGVFWILDFCTEARRLERRVSFFEKREEAKDRERRTSRGARKIFHDDGRNRAFSSLSTTFYTDFNVISFYVKKTAGGSLDRRTRRDEDFVLESVGREGEGERKREIDGSDGAFENAGERWEDER